MGQVEVRLRGILKSLVAVELQLRGGSLFLPLHGQANGVPHQVNCLLCFGLVGDDSVAVELPDHGQIQYALPGVDAGDVRYPFAVGFVRVKLPVRQIFVLVDLLPHLLPLSAPADIRQQIMLLHDPQHGFGITEDIPAFRPWPHPPVAIGAEAALSLLGNDFCKSCVLPRSAKALDKLIIAAPEYFKEFAHNCYWILCSVPIDDVAFYPRHHFLPMNRRKSRSSLFSMRSYRISLACSAAISLGKASFLGRPLGRERIPDSCFRFFLRSRASKCFTTYLLKIYNMTLLPAAPSPLPA